MLVDKPGIETIDGLSDDETENQTICWIFKMLIIHCDGGLGNRLNCLAGGLAIAKAVDCGFRVNWPQNRYLQADIDQILSVSFEYDRCSKEELKLAKISSTVSFENFLLHPDEEYINPILTMRRAAIIEFCRKRIKNSAKVLVFTPQVIPAFYRDVSNIIRSFKYSDQVANYIRPVICAQHLPKNYLGLHMRGTDSGVSLKQKTRWRWLCSVLPARVRLITDDYEIVNLFSNLGNISVRRDFISPDKAIVGLAYNECTVDENGQYLPYNIVRSKESILDSIVDLEILSASIIIPTSGSTFLETAVIRGSRKNVLVLILFHVRAVLRVFRNILLIYVNRLLSP